ncbi:MAG: hypothetical protein L3J23_00410 [Flavobacteriaceae bacterium]|nr:hypothetical protein [Flavobacteriaceae bacterium]
MYKFLFKRLLLANYSFARRWINKKVPQQIIPGTLHIFTSPFTFIAAGIYAVILGSIEFKFKSFPPIFIGLSLVMLPLHFFILKRAKKAIYQWKIEKEYKTLTRNQRFNKNTFAFIFFWGSFALSFYLIVTYTESYLLKLQ